MATDQVIDIIADIEMRRQETEKTADLKRSCNEALRRLHELLEHEKKALQLHGPSAEHPTNIEAVTIEIERVRRLAGTTRQGSIPKSAGPGQQQGSWRNASRGPSRTRGRRTMGRRGGG